MSDKTKEELEREVERLREADERWGRNHQLVIEERAEALRRVKELEAEVDRQANLISSYEHNIDHARERIAALSKPAALPAEGKGESEDFQDGWDAHELHVAMHSEPYRFAFPTMLRKMWSGSEVQAWLDKLPPLYELPATPPAPQPLEGMPTQRQMNEAFYIDVCQAEDRLREFIETGRKLLDSLPAHWHGEAESELRDLCDETSAVLNPHMHTPYQVEQAVKRYGRAALSPAPQPVGEVRDGWAPFGSDAAFTFGQRLTKTKGSSWTGKVVGFYATSLTPRGYCIESENEPGSVQLYPEAAMEKADG